MNQHYDVIIVGGGPSGSTCALALKHSGLKVLMLDKASFPRDKICGDAVSSTTKRVLREIDPLLEQDLLAFAPKTYIKQVKVYSPKFQSLLLGLTLTGHCIRRVDFDNWLFKKAITNPTLTVLQNTTLKTVETTNNFVTINTNDGQIFTTNIIVGCDGALSIVAKQLASFKIDKQHYSAATRQYYSNVKGLAGNAIEVYFLKGYLPGYFWIFPLSNNEANVGFGMLSSVIAKHKIDLKQCLHKIITEIPEVATRFAEAIPLETVKGFGLPLASKKYNLSGNRFMLCGDAASLIDPISGEGIETAMESGKFAAQHIIQAFKTNNFSAAAFKAYDKQVYDKMWPNFKKHYYLQRLLSNRVWLINILIAIGNIRFLKTTANEAYFSTTKQKNGVG